MASANLGVPLARLVIAGAGLVGGGTMEADRTFDIAAGDGSIVVSADDIVVGILATDAQHGARGGGTQHAAATGSVAGFMSAADKTKLDTYPATPGALSHSALSDLGADDHGQYHTDARGDARYFRKAEFLTVSAGGADVGKPVVLDAGGHIDASMINDADLDHGSIGGLADDDHSIYHTDARGDARYFRENEFIQTSTGAPDGGKPIILDANGAISGTMLNPASLDHGGLTGKADDDHPQYRDGSIGWTGAPVPNGSQDIGVTGNRWGNVFAASAALGGATLAGGAPSAQNLVIGDFSGDAGISLLIDASGFGRFAITDDSGLKRGELKYRDAPAAWTVSMVGADYYFLSAAAVYPNADNARTLGISAGSNRWANIFSVLGNFGGNVTMGANLDLTAASPTATFGDGTGSPNLDIDKEAAGNSEIRFQTAGDLDWIIQDSSTELLAFRRYIANVFQDIPFRITNSTGLVTINGSTFVVGGLVSVPSDLDSPGGGNLGSDSVRWGTVFADNLTAGGGEVADATSEANLMVLGDGTGNAGFTLFASGGDFARFFATDVSGAAPRGIFQYGFSAEEWSWQANATSVMILDEVDLRPFTTGAINLGSAAREWGDVFSILGTFSGNVTMSGSTATLALTDALSRLSIGGGTLQAGDAIQVNKAGGNEARFRWRNDDNLMWGWKFRTDERLQFESWDSAGDNNALIFDLPANVAGAVSVDIVSALLVSSDGTAVLDGGLAIAGAAIANGPGNYDDLVLGPGSGSRGITIFTGTGDSGGVNMTDVTGTVVGQWRYDHAASAGHIWVFQGTDAMRLNGNELRPQTDGALNLGIDGTRWGTVFADNLTAGGAEVADGQAGRDDLVLGDGVGDRGMFIFSGDASSAWIVLSDTSGTNNNGAFQYSMGAARFQIYAAGAHVINLSAGDLGPQTDGAMTSGTAARRWSDVHADQITIAGDGFFTGDLALDGDLFVGSVAGREATKLDPGRVQTTDGTLTNAKTVATLTANGQNAKVRIFATGIGNGGAADDGDNLSHVEEVTFYRDAGAIQKMTAHIADTQTSSAGAAAWPGVTLVAIANDIFARVQAVGGETVDWDVEVDVQISGQ